MQGSRMSVRMADHYNHRLASLGCEWIDQLLEDRSPGILNNVQERLYRIIADTEEQIRGLMRRERRRRKRWARLPKPDRDSAACRDSHLEQLERRRDVLDERRRLLRQIGDACAWIVLGGEPREIRPLYSASRSQHLPGDEGALGPLSVMQLAHGSGKFRVILADLTRCVGVGDLVAVSTEAPAPCPLVFEVKTRKHDSSSVAIWLMGRAPKSESERAQLREFARVTGCSFESPPHLRDRERRQVAEIHASGALAAQLWGHVGNLIPESGEVNWSRTEDLLNRAWDDGFAFDFVEDGLIHAGVRNAPGDDYGELLARLFATMHRSGAVRSPGDWSIMPTAELIANDAFSTVVLPIALWQLPRVQRTALLNSELDLISLQHREVWANAFRAEGLDWVEEVGWWKLEFRGKRVIFDALEVTRLKAGAAFSSINPRTLARIAAAQMSGG